MVTWFLQNMPSREIILSIPGIFAPPLGNQVNVFDLTKKILLEFKKKK